MKSCFNINKNWYTQSVYHVVKLQYYKTVVYITLTTTTLKLKYTSQIRSSTV